MGENIAAGHSTPEEVMTGWMNSKGHRENILRPGFKEIGIGCVEKGGTYYWVQCFGDKSAPYSYPANNTSKTFEINTKIDHLDMFMDTNRAQTKAHVYTRTPHSLGYTVYLQPQYFTFTSSNRNVATVDKCGNIKKIGGGSATITAQKGRQKVSKQVSFSGEAYDPDKPNQTLAKKIVKVYCCTSKTLKPDFKYAKYLKWSSANTSIATVDNNGKVTAKYPGATYVYGKYGNTTYRYRVRVTPNGPRNFSSKLSNGYVVLNWKNAPGADGVVVYRGIKKGDKYQYSVLKTVTRSEGTSTKIYAQYDKGYAFKLRSFKYIDSFKYSGGATKTHYWTKRMPRARIQVYQVNSNVKSLLSLINKERRANGLDPLTLDKGLSKYAMLRAAETTIMMESGRPNGGSYSSGFSSKHTVGSENVAVGHKTPQKVMTSGMQVELHRENILNPNYKTIGIGCVQKNGFNYWVEEFGTYRENFTPASSNYNVTYAVRCLPKNANLVISLNKNKTYASIYHRSKNSNILGNIKLQPTSVKWVSMNSKIASIDKYGKITKKKSGKVTIKAVFGDKMVSIYISL